MQWILLIDLPWRYLLLWVVGLLAGGFANYLIYSWAYFPRHISPWAPPPSAPGNRTGEATHLPKRRWTDRIPVVGWLGLRREAELHGARFWLRPMAIEIGCGAAIPWMYRFYTQAGGLLPPELRTVAAIDQFASWSHSLFVVHGLLFVLMVAATFIDFDEQTIPDIITLPGTLVAILFSMLPWRSFLPAVVIWGERRSVAETTFNVPWPFDPRWFDAGGLWLALAIWSVWIFALTDRHWVLRRGPIRTILYLIHGIRRRRESKWLLGLGIVGGFAITGVWLWDAEAWPGLLTALVGMAVGGGTVWAVRIVAGYAIGQEAMGFGDVTLMAMIGAFVGWQAAIAGFFLAPISAILIVLIQYVLTRQPVVPFGPYLCVGTTIAVVGWHTVWNETMARYVELGSIAFWILVVALVAMGAMLVVWRQIKRLIFR
jgi:prepilin signal peptidase PulO-like enzyme (type II secretory pathway)